MRANENKYVAIELLGMAFLSTAGIWVKLAHIGPISMGFYRMVLTLIILFPFMYKSLRGVTKKQFILAFLGGLGLGGDVLFWNLGLMKTSMANCALLVNLTVFIVPPISYFLFKEKIRKEFLVGEIIAFVGVVIVIFSSSMGAGGEASVEGDLIAILASISYSAYMLFVYKVRDELNNNAVVLITTFGAMVVLFFSMIPTEGLIPKFDLRDVILLVCYTVCTQILGQALISMCLGKLNATLVTVISLLGIATAAIYAYFIFGETLMFMEVVGMVITIIGVFMAKQSSQKA